ncbi:MAG: hypothetical protein ACPG32_04470 [Akkermansiaceae bacterium]
MSAKDQAKKEVLEMELDTVQMLRRRAKDDAVKAIAAGERELELKAEIEKLESKSAA